MRKTFLRMVLVILGLLFIADMAHLLVVDERRKADVIVVLAGETDLRPTLGLELLRQGLAQHLILDVPAKAKIFRWSEIEIAQRYVQSLPEAPSITVCPVEGLSTKAETADVARCLKDLPAKEVLVVTSDYHTRRALSIFSKELPAYKWTIAAAADSQQFGSQWWRHREWAKTCLYEWGRLAWWEFVDRWW